MNIGLIFSMIIAIMMIGIILVFGYNQIVEMQRLQEIASVKRTVDGLETAVDRVYSGSGENSERFQLSFPGSVYKVCFIPGYSGDPASYRGVLRSDLSE